MSQRIEFGTKTAADAFRDEFEDHVCPVDDDRRMKTVALVSDAPDHVVEQAEVQAAASRGERESDGGQVALTDREREAIDFSEGRASVPWARSIKGIARNEGVDDWLSFLDESLTVDEHRDVMERAARDERGQRLDAEESADEKLARSEGGQCDHARGHCEHGQPEACEFLQEACGYSEEEVAQLLGRDGRDGDSADATSEQEQLVTVGGDEFPEMEVTGQEAGALQRSWQGYRGAVAGLEGVLEDVRESVVHARRAVAAINAIRERHGQDALHPDRLHDLLEALAAMPGSIPEVRTLAHFQSPGDPDDAEEVMTVDERSQADLQGDTDADVSQAGLATDPDVRAAQGRESRPAVEQASEFGVDDRSDPSRGASSDEQDTEQQQFRDPDQDSLT